MLKHKSLVNSTCVEIIWSFGPMKLNCREGEAVFLRWCLRGSSQNIGAHCLGIWNSKKYCKSPGEGLSAESKWINGVLCTSTVKKLNSGCSSSDGLETSCKEKQSIQEQSKSQKPKTYWFFWGGNSVDTLQLHTIYGLCLKVQKTYKMVPRFPNTCEMFHD